MSDYSIYVVVRKDIAPGRKAAQVAHAVAGLVDSWGWVDGMQDAVYNGYLIVLEYDPNTQSLHDLSCNYECMYKFYEPDFCLFTAAAYLVRESDRESFSHLKIAYPKRKWWKRERYNYY